VYVIVPRRATSVSASVFVGSFCDREPPLETLELGVARLAVDREEPSQRVIIPVSRWQTLSGGDAAPIFCTDVALAGLQANARYVVRLFDRRGKRLAEGALQTLPSQLPGGGSGTTRPFTLWASSCFHWKSADERLEALVEQVLADPRYRPHLNVLLGDQVYLDYPQWRRFLAWGEADLKGNFNESYARTWTQPAFRRLLSSTASVFLSDDHEFWNNHPNPPLSAWSWIRSGRFWEMWRRLALERFEAIQGRRHIEQITLVKRVAGEDRPALKLFFADTGIDRGVAGNFMSDENMATLTRWLEQLECPGVLALGQPLHTDRGSRWSRKLPGFAQFEHALVPALEKAPHDVVVIAGDAHFGRIATWRKPAGSRVIEVISSPLALVSSLAGGAASAGPQRFGTGRVVSDADSPEPARDVDYVKMMPDHALRRSKRVTEEHGLTLSFMQADEGEVHLEVRAWFPRANASARPWSWSTRLT